MLRTSLAALAAVLTASACAPISERSVEDYLTASPAAVSDYQRGKLDLGAGNYGLALDRFTNAVQLNPDNVAALNGQAISLAKLDRDEDAAATFERALKIDGTSAVTLGNYATFLEHHGDHAGAVALLAKLDPPTTPVAAAPPAQAAASAPTSSVAAPTPVSATPVVATAIEPKPALTIANASGQYRLAHRLQQYLTEQGYAADRVANAARFDRTQTVLFCHAQSRAAAEQIRRALPANVKLVVLTSKANSIELVAGSDLNTFDTRLALAAPAVKGATR